MTNYERDAWMEMKAWQQEMRRSPGYFNRMSKAMQTRINRMIPERVHVAITNAIRQMINGVLFGAEFIAPEPMQTPSLQQREVAVRKRIDVYRRTAAVEGGVAGMGGIILGVADFPVLLGIKLKMLFDIAALYGYDAADYRERVFLLHIFELSFSSDEHRRDVYMKMGNWDSKKHLLPGSIDEFDWRSLQQEYRDYIDLAKMAQLLPLVGAPVGLVVNNRLLRKLGHNAMMAYRMRLFHPAAME